MRNYLLGMLTLLCLLASQPLYAAHDKISVQLKWVHDFQFSGFYMALEKGYYHDVGLDVQLIEGGPSRSSIEYVAKHANAYGVSSTGALLERSYGKPIKAIGAIFQHSPLMLLTRADTAIATEGDLRGKRIMLQKGYQNVSIIAYLQKLGIKEGDFERQDISYNIQDLIDQRTDAFAIYATNQAYKLDAQHIPYHIFNPADQGIDFYGDIVITSDEETRTNPGRVQDFMEATSRGWVDVLEHPDEAIDLILLKYNTQNLTRGHLQFEAKEAVKFILPDVVKPGYMNMFRWQRIAQVYREHGFLSEEYPIEEFVYLPEPSLSDFINDYLWQGLLFVLLMITFFLAVSAFALKGLVRRKTQALEEAVENHKNVEGKLQNLMNDMNEVYFKINSVGEIQEISDSIFVLSGYLPHELIGQSVLNYYVCAEQRDRYIEQLYQNGFVKGYELQFRSKSGDVLYVATNTRVVLDSLGNIDCMEGLFRDVTAKKEVEHALQQSRDEALKANAAKSDFLAVISHELRTPLHGIIGMHHLLAELEDLPHEQRQNLLAAQQAALSLKSIVNDILDLSKAESGMMVVNNAQLDLRGCMYETMQAFVFATREKGLAFDLILKEVPQQVIVDVCLLRQVLFNLLGNAVKFTKQGFVKLEISMTSIKGVQQLLFIVQDSGIGMRKEDAKRVFEPFFQSQGLMSVEHKGTGLGTAIVKRFMKVMQGEVWVDSEWGKGSTFTFHIPFESVAGTKKMSEQVDMLVLQKPQFTSEAGSLGSNVVHESFKVLLAEDDLISQRIGKKILLRAGLQVDVVDNGYDVVKKALSEHYHIVLMDVRMPGLDGIAATRKIREGEAIKGRRVPILGLSAHVMEDIQQECMDAGMDDFLTKPFDAKQVLKLVMQYGELLQPANS